MRHFPHRNHSKGLLSSPFFQKKLFYNKTWDATLLLLATLGLALLSLYYAEPTASLATLTTYLSSWSIVVLNALPVLLLAAFFRFACNRSWLAFALTSIIVLGFGWTNYFKILFRNDPLLAADLGTFAEAAKMAGVYQVRIDYKIALGLALCVVASLVLALFARTRFRLMPTRVLGLVLCVVIGTVGFRTVYWSDAIYRAAVNPTLKKQWISTEVYKSKGFVYPFLHSFKSAADPRPADYSAKHAQDVLARYPSEDIPAEQKINVVSIMLEAYDDFSLLPGVNPTSAVYAPLHKLQEESYHGRLLTNIFAGGTVQTEWAFLTGYARLGTFRSDTNSFPRYFASQGYTVTGAHPSTEWFYNRSNINRYLGFEDYKFLENYFQPFTKEQIAYDDVFFPQLRALYEQRDMAKPYFNFSVSYQNHGPYWKGGTGNTQYLSRDGLSEESYFILNNYLKGIADTTARFAALIDSFRKDDAPVVVVLFGDHKPWMGDGNSVYKELGVNLDTTTQEGFQNYYSTPYLIWANDAAKQQLGRDVTGEGPTVSPCFLMDVLFEQCGWQGNSFLQLERELRGRVPIIHASGRFSENGALTDTLSDPSAALYHDFDTVQYYLRKNFSPN